jgi:hypothetical protein
MDLLKGDLSENMSKMNSDVKAMEIAQLNV